MSFIFGVLTSTAFPQTVTAAPRASVAPMDLYDVPGIDSGAAPLAKAQHFIMRGNDNQKNGRNKRARTEPFGHTEMVKLFRAYMLAQFFDFDPR